MSCYSCGGNPNTFCGECIADKDTWIATVDKLPDPFMGDLDHLFRTPDGNLYALSQDRSRWIRVNGEAGVEYRAGKGISIDSDGTITNTQPNEYQNLSFNNRTLTISGGNSVVIPSDKQDLRLADRTLSITGGSSITLPEDKDTIYDDTDVQRRLNTLENKTDNFVSNVVLNREGNKITITYTFVNGSVKKVEFEDKDTIGVAYDDSALKERIKNLENKPDKDTVYNDTDVKRRLTALENKPTVTAPSYDDSGILQRLSSLESRNDKDNQKLSFNNNTGVLSITGGNSVTIPKEVQPNIRIAKSNIPIDAVPQAKSEMYIDNLLNPQEIKVGDIVQDIKYFPRSGATEINFWRVTSVDSEKIDLIYASKKTFGGTVISEPIHRFYNGKIPNTSSLDEIGVIQKNKITNVKGLKVGDTLEELYVSDNLGNKVIWEIVGIDEDTVRVKSIVSSLINHNKYISVEEYNKVKDALEKLLLDLKSSGTWSQIGTSVLDGEFSPNRHIASGRY